MRATITSFALAGLTLGACGGPPPRVIGRCEASDAGTSECVELGVGPAATPVIEGGDIEIVHGPQGGWHVELGARFRQGEDVDGLVVAYAVRREDDGATLGAVRYAINARRLVEEPPSLVRAGDLVIFDVLSGDEVIGARVEIELQLQDESGATLASDARTLVVIDAVP